MRVRTVQSLVLLAAIFLVPSSSFAANYKVDPAHSKIGFKVKHLGISYVGGAFNNYDAEFTFDPNKIEQANAKASIKVKSVDTDNKKRDDHLRSPDFFDAKDHPVMSFVSKEIKNVNGKNFTVVGDLTMNGITLPVTLDAVYKGTVTDPWGNEKAAFTAETTINRKDFGLKWNKLLETGGLVVGEEVLVSLDIQGVKQ